MKKILYTMMILLGMAAFYGCETEEEIVPVEIQDEVNDPHGGGPDEEGDQTKGDD